MKEAAGSSVSLAYLLLPANSGKRCLFHRFLALPKPKKETAAFLCLYLWVWADGMLAWALISAGAWCICSIGPAFLGWPPLWWAQWNKHGPNLTRLEQTRIQKHACMLNTLASLWNANLKRWHVKDFAGCEAASQHVTTSCWKDVWPSVHVFFPQENAKLLRNHCDGSS